MTRSIASATETKLSNNQIFVADLIELHLSSTKYFTSTNIDISYDSATAPDTGPNTYLAQGQFLAFNQITESRDLRVASIEMRFTAVDLTTLSLVVNDNFIDKRVVIYRAIFNDDYTFTDDDVWMLFDGTITSYNIEEKANESILTLTVASQFADFLRTSGRKSNPSSQNLHFSSDKGMDFSPQIVKDIKWGRA